MSESSANKKATIKNPLLQSTNFAVEDFTHNAMILAPAPPIPKEEPVSAIFSTDNRATLPKNTDNFSEVNLDSKPEPLDNTTPVYSPLEDIDSPAQLNLHEQSPDHQNGAGGGGDPQSLSAGLSASFAQLPNVASTVFSTFSRVIKGNSPLPGEVSTFDHQHIQPPVQVQNTLDDLYEHQHPSYQSQINQPFEPPHEDSAPVIPTFYSPTDPNLAKHPPLHSQPPIAGNTFRLGGLKKKAYAHIPGLSTSAAPPIPDSNILQAANTLPSAQNPAPFQSTTTPQLFQPEVSSAGYFDLTAPQPYLSSQEAPQEPSNKFSLGGLLPVATQLLQKIPSVQDFAQNFTQQPPKGPSESLNQTPTSINTPANFFGVETNPPTFPLEQTVPAQQVNPAPPPINPYNFNTSPFLQSSPGTASGTPRDSPQVTNSPSVVENVPKVETGPPPTFFSADQVPLVPKQSLSKSGNPYSNSRFGKTAVYKNPSLIPSTGQTPIILNSGIGTPVTPTNIFNPGNFVEDLRKQGEEISAPSTGQFFSPESTTPVNIFTPPKSEPTTNLPKSVTTFPPVSTVGTSEVIPQSPPTTIQPPPITSLTTQNSSNPYQRKQKPVNTVPTAPISAPINFFNPSGVNVGPEQTLVQPNIQPLAPFDFFSNQGSLNTTETDSKSQIFEDLPTSYPPPLESVAETAQNFSQTAQHPFKQESLTTLPEKTESVPIIESLEKSLTITGNTESQGTKTLSDLFGGTNNSEVQSNAKINKEVSSLFGTVETTPTQNYQNQGFTVRSDDSLNNNQKIPQQPETPHLGNTFDLFNSNKNNNNTSIESTTTTSTSEVNKRNDNDLPRFTPVHFFIDTPKSSEISLVDFINKNNNNNINSAVNFFDNPVQNQISSFFDQTNSDSVNKRTFGGVSNSSFDQYFKPQDVLPQEKLINQDIYQADQATNVNQTSSFSSFRSESVSELNQDFIDYDELPEEMVDEMDSGKLSTAPQDLKYRPVYYHWFFKTQEDPAKAQWTPFTMKDSMALDEAFRNPNQVLVHTDGGRFDVNVAERKRMPVYWKGQPNVVRRCSWFYKALDSRFVPYEEDIAEKLEEEYRMAAMSGEWHKKIPLPNGETVVFHGPTVIVHFLQSQNPDSWGSTAQPTNRPRVVKRGIDDFNIEDGESDQIDHLLFMIHGIGKACDLKFRTIEEAVDEFRSIAMQLVQSHYRTSCDLGVVGRVEVLPVSWHTELHSEEFGIDEKLKSITLESIPKLREFANDTLLDILFYSSPVFCQHIMDIVGNTMNNLISIFKKRNPEFNGGVSLGGHSLGSLILFDLLCHQKERDDHEMENLENPGEDCIVVNQIGGPPPNLERRTSQTINYTMGVAGTGQPFINYPQLSFRARNFFALGSPISMFVTVRGIDKLGLDFKLPTCEGFFNIFHPYDPVAYRCEPLICSSLSNVSPVLIPHHKGRKRMHLELKETINRVGTDLKQRILFTFKTTMQAVYSLTTKQVTDQQAIEQEVEKVLEEQLSQENSGRNRSESVCTSTPSENDAGETDLPLGQLNQSRRIDFVLQEAPLEFFNEYIFALTSHVCYWESEDTILFMMKEIYTSMGIQTDSQIPQHTLTIERPSTSSATNTLSQNIPTSPDKFAKR